MTDADNSSAADAMSWTLLEASPDAVVALSVRLEAWSAAPASCAEASTIRSAMRPSSVTVASTSPPKRSISAPSSSWRFEVLVECRTDGAVSVVVTPLAAGGRADLGAQPYQLAAKLLKLRDALGER